MAENRFLLYGANGYTGQLIARYAKSYGVAPLLAGRNEAALKHLSNQTNLDYRVVDLNDTRALEAALKETGLVLHAAGPFHDTARQMVEACLETQTHYIDINGDISVFEMIKQYDEAAKKAGIMLLPGAGFDVVPTDCTALFLKKLLPDAISLKLAFATEGGALSHGTATTMANKLGEGGNKRKDGKIVKTQLGDNGLWVEFGTKKIFFMSIPWGDVSTGYFTTGISNIETFAGVSPVVFHFLKLQVLFNWILRTEFIRNFARKKINSSPAGPSDEMRKQARSYIYGEAVNGRGEKVTTRLETPDGYTLTTHSTLIIAKKILEGNFIPGYQTPATAYGENLVFEIPGTKRL